MFKNKSILITGGTGSFGKSFVKNLIQNHGDFKKLIIFSRDELKQFEMSQQKEFQHVNLRMFLGDIRDQSRLNRAFENIDIVIHAAALKQVPAAEYNPFEFIKTNIVGTENVINAALDHKVKNVISLSTDKASSPINLYGASKLCSDKLILAANNFKGSKKTNFSVVRYGNVSNSRGSVIPLFKKINSFKKKLPLTHKEMTRFNISVEEGVQMVDWVTRNAIGGEIYVPKIPSYRITDLAKAMNPKNKLKIVGIRRGEKIHEEMITVGDSQSTYQLNEYYLILPDNSIEIFKKFKKRFPKIKKVKENFNYSSEKNENFLKVSEIEKMIKKFF